MKLKKWNIRTDLILYQNLPIDGARNDYGKEGGGVIWEELDLDPSWPSGTHQNKVQVD